MNLFFKSIYYFLWVLTRITTWIYYPRTTIIHPERLKFDHPAILVSNHPNTLLDVLNVALRTRPQVYFLANAGMFAHPWADWFLSNYCIPIKRKSDSHIKHVSNAASFNKADRFFSEKKDACLYIAAEGTSELERRLRPLKTGFARIALSAESKNNYQLGMKVIPVGLTYERANYFRTRLVMKVGEPMLVADYKTQYDEDNIKAVRAMTQQLRIKMLPLLIHTEDEAEDDLLRKTEIMYQHENPISDKTAFYRSQSILKNFHDLEKEDPAKFTKLKNVVHKYFSALAKTSTNDYAVFAKTSKRSIAGRFLLILLGLPLFLYGLLNNVLPVCATLGIVRKMNLHVGYNSTAKGTAGLIMFPLFYSLQIGLIQYFFQDFWLSLLYAISLIPLGIIAWKWWKYVQQFAKSWNFYSLSKKEKKQLLAERGLAWQEVRQLVG